MLFKYEKKAISQHSKNIGNSKWRKLDMEGPEMWPEMWPLSAQKREKSCQVLWEDDSEYRLNYSGWQELWAQGLRWLLYLSKGWWIRTGTKIEGVGIEEEDTDSRGI